MVASARMHERSERALCRLTFLLLCALPTLVTLCGVIVTLTPWYHRGEIRRLESMLNQRLGVVVQIGDMEHGKPGYWELRDVVLRHPETDREVARVATVLFTRNDRKMGVHLSQPQIQAEQLSTVWNLIHDRFLCQPQLTGELVQLGAEGLTLLGSPQAITLTPVDVLVKSDDRQTTASMRFALAGESATAKRARLDVHRIRDSVSPRTTWVLESGDTPLPCGVLATYLPVMRRLGPEAEFSGLVRWEQQQSDYQVRLENARFANVNMLDLSQPFDFPFSGVGLIEVDSLHRLGGQPIQWAQGRLTVEGAKIDSRLIRRLAFEMGAKVDLERLEAATRIDCDLISLGFTLDQAGVSTRGLCYRQPEYGRLPPGTAMISAGKAFAVLEPNQSITGEQLGYALDRAGRLQLPIGAPIDIAKRLLPDLDTATERNRQPSAESSSPVVHSVYLKQE